MRATKIGKLFKSGNKNPEFAHGHACRGKHSTEYNIWTNMMQRCFNKNNPDFLNYGGRGITVCKRWMNFALFFQDTGKRPGKEFTLDRRKVNQNYSPSNCRWATHKQQALNRRKAGSIHNFTNKELCDEIKRRKLIFV